MNLGLTGGIGCGKSTVGKLFEKKGWKRSDSDAIVHDLLARDQGTIDEVAKLFGDEVLLPDGGVDRAKLAPLVFGDSERLRGLEQILHPRVRQRWESDLESGGDWVLEIPLLFEKNLQNRVDITVCVFCHPQTQIERLEGRGMTHSQAQSRIQQQMPLSDKARLADHVLLNDGSLATLEAQLDLLIDQLKNPKS